MRNFLIIFTLFIMAVSCSSNKKSMGKSIETGTRVLWTETVDGNTEIKDSLALLKGEADYPEVEIFLEKENQTINGFGGAFNEAGWDALSILTEEERDSVMQNLFDPEGEGLHLNMGRVPIGSSDYALIHYSHNETPGDYAMENFSIDRDYLYLIPYIKAAMKYYPDLPVWGSAWSPPTWMKDNNRFPAGHMLDDPKIYDAYALYLVKFIQAYQKEGINLFEVAVQNEPKVVTGYPNGEWEPEQYYTFIKDHLSPLMDKEQIEAGIMLGTFNFGDELDYYIAPVLDDPEAAERISSVGFQWDGVRAVADTRKAYPEMTIVQTETECGNWHWNGRWDREIKGYRFNSQRPQNDFPYAAYTWDRIRDYFKQGVNSYFLWNIVLDERGLNNDERRRWPQNAAVVVDRPSESVIYTPMYKAFWHFSHFVEPGAVYVESKSRSNNVVVFKNPEGNYIVVMQNKKEEIQDITVKLGEYNFSITLPAKSFHTFQLNPEL